MKYTVRSLGDRTFSAEFTDQFDLAMTFWRCQEFYESPNPSFRGKSFTLLSFMKWYCETQGEGGFSYPYDWSGFNLPSRAITACFRKGIPDPSKYDGAMREIYRFCRSRTPIFYLIGVMAGDEKTVRHELAHARWALNTEYRREMKHCLSQLPARTIAALTNGVMKMGYAKAVVQDEVQAYLATGVANELSAISIPEKNTKMFKDVYKRYLT